MADAFGGYDVLAEVGGDGTGAVVRALDPGSGRAVAIKRVADASTESATRLGAYGRLIGMLLHPNIVEVHEVLRTADEVYLVEEWIDGAALDDLRTGPLDGQPAVAILLGVLGGLAHAHDRGVVHGDVCPGNILLTTTGTPRLTNFGLAGPLGATRSPSAQGFTSPEAAAGRVLIPASDVYSAAVILLAVTFRPDENNAAAPVPGLSPRIGAVLATALDPVPEKRYADAGAFLRALDAAADETFGFGWQTGVDLALLSRGSLSAVSARPRPRSRLSRRSRTAVGGAGILPRQERRSRS